MILEKYQTKTKRVFPKGVKKLVNRYVFPKGVKKLVNRYVFPKGVKKLVKRIFPKRHKTI